MPNSQGCDENHFISALLIHGLGEQEEEKEGGSGLFLKPETGYLTERGEKEVVFLLPLTQHSICTAS